MWCAMTRLASIAALHLAAFLGAASLTWQVLAW